MIKMKKFLSVLMLMVMVFAMVSCGGTSEEAATEEDGQNPVMNLVGTYACDRASILIAAKGQDGIVATVTWGSSAFETSEWAMTGTFDSETLSFKYEDCIRTNIAFAEDGTIQSEERVYSGGHGSMTFTDGEKITLVWQDDEEDVAKDMVFEYAN